LVGGVDLKVFAKTLTTKRDEMDRWFNELFIKRFGGAILLFFVD